MADEKIEVLKNPEVISPVKVKKPRKKYVRKKKVIAKKAKFGTPEWFQNQMAHAKAAWTVVVMILGLLGYKLVPKAIEDAKATPTPPPVTQPNK